MSDDEQLISLYRRPEKLEISTCEIDRRSYDCLLIEQLVNDLMDSTFENVVSRLHSDLDVEAEPDGSFVVAGGARNDRWEIAGMLYDGGPSLAYVDLQGNGPREVWLKLLIALVDQDAADGLEDYMIFLRSQGRFLTVESFLDLAAI